MSWSSRLITVNPRQLLATSSRGLGGSPKCLSRYDSKKSPEDTRGTSAGRSDVPPNVFLWMCLVGRSIDFQDLRRSGMGFLRRPYDATRTSVGSPTNLPRMPHKTLAGYL